MAGFVARNERGRKRISQMDEHRYKENHAETFGKVCCFLFNNVLFASSCSHFKPWRDFKPWCGYAFTDDCPSTVSSWLQRGRTRVGHNENVWSMRITLSQLCVISMDDVSTGKVYRRHKQFRLVGDTSCDATYVRTSIKNPLLSITQ